jgi:2-(1,2-epoxy-1,2-dihydrophenyl)acetyl-CoA isomerase
MAMLGERVPAAKALDWGLINRVVADDELESTSTALLQRLANGPTRSYAGSKLLLNRRLYADLAGQLDAEAEAQRDQGQSKDFIEGVVAFVEKREPNFTGD